ncbi:hypothetical protein CRV24_002767 [Beauveria bassiana]|nr:hypothetical protein CRV24_002767 [Beauveria bassiana]
MYQGGQRHVSNNDPTRPFQVPPPPPPPLSSPPMNGPQMGSIMNVPRRRHDTLLHHLGLRLVP